MAIWARYCGGPKAILVLWRVQFLEDLSYPTNEPYSTTHNGWYKTNLLITIVVVPNVYMMADMLQIMGQFIAGGVHEQINDIP